MRCESSHPRGGRQVSATIPGGEGVIRTNGYGIPIIALDIDNTLGDYHAHFLHFAENWFGKAMPHPGAINPGLPLYKFMGVSKARYREAKLAYRQGGWKRWMPAYPGASELTQDLRAAGAEVWICTTRPYLRLDNIDPDTREWLRRNRIRYNAVLFGEHKYKELKRQAGDRVVAVVDDLPEMLQAARQNGFDNLYMRSQPYNTDCPVPSFTSSYELWTLLKNDLLRWKGKL